MNGRFLPGKIALIALASSDTLFEKIKNKDKSRKVAPIAWASSDASGWATLPSKSSQGEDWAVY